ncbi:glycosyltransferase family 2 protein [soil metagenome]
MPKTTVDICIATFKRPAMLNGLFASLRLQQRAGVEVRIIVIDNDREQSAKPCVDAFRAAGEFEVIYDVEPQQNIAMARNRALSHVKSDYFAFLDDDESAAPQWLQSMLESLNRHQADIVFGPVVCLLPDGAPAWAEQCFTRPRRATGSGMEFGGAGNVMARSKVINRLGARFDPAYGLTGGEDTEFFYRMFCAGHRMIWCDEALVTEPVLPSRLTLSWIRRRGFRGGQTYQRIFVSRFSGLKKAKWLATKLAQLATAVLAAPLVRCFSYRSYVALTVRIAAAAGQLTSHFSGEHFEEYSVRRYQ